MSQSFPMRASLSLMALVLWLDPAMSQDTAKDKEAAEKFATLKSKLPATVKKNLVEQLGGQMSNVRIEVKLARRFSPVEGKIMFRVLATGKSGDFEPAFLVVYLRYFDGTWTTTQMDGRWSFFPDNEKPGDTRLSMSIMLAIDNITSE